MIRVLFVNDNLRLPAGITMVIKNIVDYCESSEIEFSILTIKSERNNALEYFQSKGVKIYYMPVATTTSSSNRLKQFLSKVNFLSLFKIRRFFMKFFRDTSFDVVHSHFAQIDKLMFPSARKFGVRCCISHSHSSKLSDSYIRAIRNKIICRGLIEVADYCAACSNMAGVALFGKSFLSSEKKLIINNGIRVSEFEYNHKERYEIRKKYDISDDTFVIGHVGRLNKVKNQSFLIEVLSMLRNKSIDNYVLMLVGSGECELELKSMVHKYDLKDHVIFAGPQSGVSSYMSSFDLFVMPSLHEGLGIAAIEAQANGLECIVSSKVPQEVDLTKITFLDINDSKLWVDEIIRKTKTHHLEYKQIVIEKGYDISQVCQKLILLYNNVISKYE